MITIERTSDAIKKFMDKFEYMPNYPNGEENEDDEYVAILEKSITDNFDYTIKKYGTKPYKKNSSRPVIIWD